MEVIAGFAQAVQDGTEKIIVEKQKELENKLILFMADMQKNNMKTFCWGDISYALKVVFNLSISEDACRMRYKKIKGLTN